MVALRKSLKAIGTRNYTEAEDARPREADSGRQRRRCRRSAARELAGASNIIRASGSHWRRVRGQARARWSRPITHEARGSAEVVARLTNEGQETLKAETSPGRQQLARGWPTPPGGDRCNRRNRRWAGGAIGARWRQKRKRSSGAREARRARSGEGAQMKRVGGTPRPGEHCGERSAMFRRKVDLVRCFQRLTWLRGRVKRAVPSW